MANNAVSVEFLTEQQAVECIKERVLRYFSNPVKFNKENYVKVYDVNYLVQKKKPVPNRNGISYQLSGSFQVMNGLTNSKRYTELYCKIES